MQNSPRLNAKLAAFELLSNLLATPFVVVDIDGTTWESWRSNLRDRLLQLEDGPMLGIVTGPLDRDPSSWPRQSLVSKVKMKFTRFTDLDVMPNIAVFRDGNSLTMICPGPPETGGMFPWSDDEYSKLLKIGWTLHEFSIHRDLYFFSPPEKPAQHVVFLSDNDEERAELLDRACELISHTFEHVLGHADPSLVHVGQHLNDDEV